MFLNKHDVRGRFGPRFQLCAPVLLRPLRIVVAALVSLKNRAHRRAPHDRFSGKHGAPAYCFAETGSFNR